MPAGGPGPRRQPLQGQPYTGPKWAELADAGREWQDLETAAEHRAGMSSRSAVLKGRERSPKVLKRAMASPRQERAQGWALRSLSWPSA